MLRLLGTLLRWSLVPILAMLAWAMAGEFFRAARDALGAAFLLWTAAGFGFRLVFHLLWGRLGKEDPFEFIDTLEHELTHALAGYATFSPPVSLSATLREGGEVELKGANPLAVLAPYCLPLWCLAGALIGLAIRPALEAAWNHGLFFLLGMFAWRLSREFRWRQTDLHVYGFLFSTLLVIALLLLCVALLLWMRGLLHWGWLPNAGRRSLHVLDAAWRAARGAAAR